MQLTWSTRWERRKKNPFIPTVNTRPSSSCGSQTHTHIPTHSVQHSGSATVTTGDRDASQESVSAVGCPTPPLVDYQQMKLYQLFSSKSPLFKSTTSVSILITSESSRPPQWGSPCVSGRRPRSGNRRDSRVCRNNGEWHRTSSHSGSRILSWRKVSQSTLKLQTLYIQRTARNVIYLQTIRITCEKKKWTQKFRERVQNLMKCIMNYSMLNIN